MKCRKHLVALLILPFLVQACTSTSRDDQLTAFRTNLAARSSATESLRIWCERRAIARPAVIIANAAKTGMVEPPKQIRALLSVKADEPLAYRHVRLTCGTAVLSVAHNWYVPARLTDEMNRQLRDSDIPFGKVVAALGFRRQTISSTTKKDGACPGGTILANRALLTAADGRKISVVIECYTTANLQDAAPDMN